MPRMRTEAQVRNTKRWFHLGTLTSLRSWLAGKRQFYRLMQLSDERKQRLETLSLELERELEQAAIDLGWKKKT